MWATSLIAHGSPLQETLMNISPPYNKNVAFFRDEYLLWWWFIPDEDNTYCLKSVCGFNSYEDARNDFVSLYEYA
jgi:hypothetical protein